MLLFSPASLHAAALDEAFVAGLRERQLFTLAENYCLRELQRPDLTPERRTTLAIELVRSLAEHALYAAPEERDTYWKQAHGVAADFLQGLRPGEPEADRAGLLMQLQDALTHLTHGELLRQEVQADLADQTRLEPAKAELRQAISGLEKSSERIAAALRATGPALRASSSGFSAAELQALQRNVDYQLARALRNQGLCYPAESPDRANSLIQAVERLAPLAELTNADETIWRSRVDLIVCQRLLKQFPAATQSLAKLIAAQPTPPYLLRAMAEKIRLELDQKQLEQALESMKQGRTSQGRQSAELDFAHLETMIAAWRAAVSTDDKVSAAAWQQRATAQVQILEREYGAYWMRRAETQLAALVSAGENADLATLRRAAESYFRGGRWDEALQTYDRAAALAQQGGDADAAFALAFTAASLAHERPDFEQALQRYRRLALALPKQPRASEAHLLAIVNAVELARVASDAERSARMQLYETLLKEHLAAWPSADSTDQVRLWLGKLLESRRDWSGAMAVYSAVQRTHARHPQAVEGALRAAEANIQAALADGKSAEELAQAAALMCEEQIVTKEGGWPAKWSSAQLACALAAAKFRLQYTSKGAGPAEHVLTAALTMSPDAPEEWQSEARLLLVSALASQGKQAEATAQLKQISGGSVRGLLTALAELDRLAESAQGQQRAGLADLELRLTELLAERRQEMDEAEIRKLETMRAAALVRAGHPLEALAEYETLVKQYPRDGEIHEAHASLLSLATDARSHQVALEKWRAVEQKTPRGEPRWFRARLAQAELLLRLNDKAGAAKLIKLTAILQPELGGEEMEKQFTALLQKAER